MIEVVKIGGNVVDNPDALSAFLADFASLPSPKILIHGGGKEATRLSKTLGIKTTMIEGRRVTDADTLQVVTMVYAGLINKRIVSLLQSLGCNAVGLSGADGNLIPAKRRNPEPVDYGFVGDIDAAKVNSDMLYSLLNGEFTPVVCAICHDSNGLLLNCNADSVAGAVAVGASRLGSVRLTYCFEQPGVMRDVADSNSVIPMIDEAGFEQLRADGIVDKGMIPKLHNALRCASAGVSEVRICSSQALLGSSGTIIRSER